MQMRHGYFQIFWGQPYRASLGSKNASKNGCTDFPDFLYGIACYDHHHHHHRKHFSTSTPRRSGWMVVAALLPAPRPLSSVRFMTTETTIAASSFRFHITGFRGGWCAALFSLLSPPRQPPPLMTVTFQNERFCTNF